MIRKILGVILASLTFLLVYALFPNLWLLEVFGQDRAALVGLCKMVCSVAAALLVYYRWGPTKSVDER